MAILFFTSVDFDMEEMCDNMFNVDMYVIVRLARVVKCTRKTSTDLSCFLSD